MSEVTKAVADLNQYFATGKTYSVATRKQQLRNLKRLLLENEEQLNEALIKDLGKSSFESYETEVGLVLSEVNHTLKKLSGWARPKRERTPLTHFLSSTHSYYDPYGIALVIVPWNYPILLSLEPLIGAIGAGNCVALKLSEYAMATSELLATLIPQYLDEQWVKVFLGGVETTQTLLAERFDTIFFTGSSRVGSIVMTAAAKNLTPVTLELGGKSPCIVTAKANLKLAAKRIVWGKFLNAGQTCVAPDYLLVEESVKEPLLKYMQEYITHFFGEKPLNSEDYGKIVNQYHFERLNGLMHDGKIQIGGEVDTKNFKIAPTILDQVTWEDKIMQEEIFGPLLPILTYQRFEEILALLQTKPKALATYLFTESKAEEGMLLQNLSFGGGCVNDTVVHMASSLVPFGGVGTSGMGHYHGKASFETFSHRKVILKKSTKFDIPVRYAPYSKGKLSLLRKILK
jgi:aldehyde dehydrogenase (NAD+)